MRRRGFILTLALVVALGLFILLGLLFPVSAHACKPAVRPQVSVTVAKRAACHAPRFVTVRVIVRAEGRTITVVVRIPHQGRPASRVRVIR